MRVKDPFEDIDVNPRRAFAVTLALVAAVVVWAVFQPRQAALFGMIIAFLFIILLHEAGHLAMAKRAGMKVTEFFVGFGPRLWSVQRGETEYGVKAIPLGGYCRVIGMTNLEEVAPEDEPRVYRSKSWHDKVLMAVAGPSVHFVLAVVLMAVVLLGAGDLQSRRATTTLGEVTLGAAAAGLRAGDVLVAIDGTPVTDWSQVPALVSGTPADPRPAGSVVRITVEREGADISVPVTLRDSGDPELRRAVAGIGSRIEVPQPGVVGAIALAPVRVAQFTWESVKALGSMFSPAGITNYFRLLTGDTGPQTNEAQRFVSPVGFGQLANNAVRAGWVDALGLLIAINIFVGLFNLLPLLPFDGGHIAIATYEKLASLVRRRRVQVDAAKLLPVTVAVVAVLGFIFLSSLFLDITRPVQNPF
ncbi:MAG: M50 family metallopeptidase [Actinomycetota bacterium]